MMIIREEVKDGGHKEEHLHRTQPWLVVVESSSFADVGSLDGSREKINWEMAE